MRLLIQRAHSSFVLRYLPLTTKRKVFPILSSWNPYTSGCQLINFRKKSISISNLFHSGNVSSKFANNFRMCSTEPNKKPFERLPNSVVPINYDITIKPDLVKFVFSGHEKITIQVKEATQTIKLNYREIVISLQDLVVSYGSKKIGIDKVDYDVEKETATLSFKECLPVGEAVLDLKFDGIVNDRLKGFYRSKYTGPDGKLRNCGVTQFEATEARSAFPCWDEPAIKASFDITFVLPADSKDIGLSNMSVLSDSIVDSNRIIKFNRSPIMSTYLVAFVIGEFDYLETKSECGVKIRVYTPIGKSEQGRFAMEVAAKALDYYKEYFQIAYPLDKMDLIAVPDFECGAMENWGLVTYRETCLLVDPKNTSTARKQYIAIIVAHELAHQWFGNLVTMEWWTHLWLNEGFATFMEYLCVDKLFPNFEIWNQFISDVYLEAMELDGLDNSHPIEIAVGHPSEVDEIFDDISYAKGASVIRMLYNYLGDDTFRKGMNMYLTRHSYKNTLTEDLWSSLEEASSKPVQAIMSTWTKQKGFPVISVSTISSSESSRLIKLTQEKYSLTGKLTNEEKNSLWSIPLTAVSKMSNGKLVIDTLFDTREKELTLNIKSNEWVKLNTSAIGTYRVRYDSEMLNQILPEISSLPPLDRVALLSDLYALVQAGKQSAVDLIKLMAVFKGERHYSVWSVLSLIMGKLNHLFSGTEIQEPFKRFGRSLINAEVFPFIGWTPKPDEPYLNTLLRTLIIHRLVVFDDPDVIQNCLKMFQDHVDGKEAIPADIRSSTYRAVASRADQSMDSLLKLYRQSDFTEEKNRIADSLGYVKNPELIKQTLQFSMSDEVRSQDLIFVVRSVALNPIGREMAWQFFKDNREKFISIYGHGALMCRLVKSVTENFISLEHANELEKYFLENNILGAERTVQQSIETIRQNARSEERV